MASRRRQTHCQPARQQVTLKPDPKKGREQEKSRSAPSGDVWDYYLGEGLKVRFIKRHSKADQKPVCEPEVWDYDSDDTIPYGPDISENLKALDIRHRDKALEQMSSDSVSNDSGSDLSCVQRGNDRNDKNTCHLDIEVDPVPDPAPNTRLIICDYYNSADNANVHNMDDEFAMDIITKICHDTNQDTFYEFVDIMNDEEISDIDDFMNHNLQQQHG